MSPSAFLCGNSLKSTPDPQWKTLFINMAEQFVDNGIEFLAVRSWSEHRAGYSSFSDQLADCPSKVPSTLFASPRRSASVIRNLERTLKVSPHAACGWTRNCFRTIISPAVGVLPACIGKRRMIWIFPGKLRSSPSIERSNPSSGDRRTLPPFFRRVPTNACTKNTSCGMLAALRPRRIHRDGASPNLGFFFSSSLRLTLNLEAVLSLICVVVQQESLNFLISEGFFQSSGSCPVPSP